MPSFEFTSPEGKKYTVAGPDGATKEQAFAILQQQIAGGTAQSSDSAVSADKPGFLSQAAHQLGLTARYGIEGATAGIGAITDPVISAIGGGVRAVTGNNYQPATLAGVGQSAANALGLPEPDGSQERLVGALTRGMVGGATGAGAAGAIAKTVGAGASGAMSAADAAAASQAPTSVTQAVMQNLAAAPVAQAAAGGAAGLAGQGVAEYGGGEGAQLAASLAAGIAAPVAGVGVARAARAVRAKPVAPIEPVATPEPADAAKLTAMTKDATDSITGKAEATQDLADQTMPDPKTVAAAKRLGIEEHLQPDHVTTNQAYRELSQAVKSIPGSEAHAAETQGLAEVGKRASSLVDEYGGTHDLSTLDQGVKTRMQSTIDDLSDKADKAYSDLRSAIPARDPVAAPSVLKFIKDRADDLGGAENLTSMERSIVRKLTPKETTNDAGETVVTPPTYALLDDVRRDLTAARVKKQGPFKDADTGLIKVLENNLQTDQRAAIEPYGQTDQFNAAQGLVKVRKGVESDMASLFGKQLNGSIVGDLKSSLAALPKGDTSKFINFIKAVPEEMRQQVVASGLSTAFNVSAKNQTPSFTNYAHFYEGLMRNKQAAAAVMSNLPPQARKQLSDLYRVSKGISMATRERITTGRINAIRDDFKPADNLGARLYAAAKHQVVGVGAGAATGAATSAILGPVAGSAVGAAVASALSKGAKPDAIAAADRLLTSPDFLAAVKRAQEGYPRQASKQFVGTRVFKAFASAIKNPRVIGNPEAFVLDALTAHDTNQAANTSKKEKNAAR